MTPDAHAVTRIEEVPVDPPPKDEGNDSKNVHVLRAAGNAVNGFADTGGGGANKPRNAATPPTAKFAPLMRNLKVGCKGPDVFALQRVLKRIGVRMEPPTGSFGPETAKQVKAAQAKYELDADGEYGPNTHTALAGFYDAFGSSLLGRAPHPDTKETMIRAIVAAAMLGYQNRETIHYTQGSLRMQGVLSQLRPPAFPHYADCSSFFTWCYYVAGAPDPNGLGYNGEGYTGTLYQNGRPAQSIDRGYAALYGPPTGAHVAIGVGGGRVVSHGSEAGPYLLDTAAYRGDLHQIRSYL